MMNGLGGFCCKDIKKYSSYQIKQKKYQKQNLKIKNENFFIHLD